MDKIIREKDKVKIINPEIFVRYGYPMSKDETINKIDEKYQSDIVKFLTDLNITGIKEKINTNLVFNDGDFIRAYEDICKALAYYLMKKKKFGGNTRSIYTETEKRFMGKIGEVIGIHRVMTGKYVSDYYDEYGMEYIPARLEKQKSHKILTILIEKEFFEIEDINVEKIFI